jgi:regulator of protease activity HflC (stomatin/prohibitin superfamily)
MFDRTGPLALWTGGNGLTGPILGPGTYYTGLYDMLRIVDCSESVEHEELQSLTRDGVQFGLEAEITYSIDCSDDSVRDVLTTLRPNERHLITSKSAYVRYVRPSIREVVRESIAPHLANEINAERDTIIDDIRSRFAKSMEKGSRSFIVINTLALTNMDFPEKLDQANTDRAQPAILREKAVAERERVEAETETAKMRKQLRGRQGEAEAARIDAIGAALKRNPGYLRYDLQQRMPGIYEKAGLAGNLVIAAPSPTILVSPRRAPREQ